MRLKNRNFAGLLLFACVLALAGCAQQGGGLLQPTPKQIISGKNTIVPSAAALSMEATNFCNAQAQVDYAGLVLYCEGKSPALPLSINTTYQTESSQFSCQVYGYTNSSNQLIVPQTVTLGNCPTGTAPAPVAAPSGAAAMKTSELDLFDRDRDAGQNASPRATSERGPNTEKRS